MTSIWSAQLIAQHPNASQNIQHVYYFYFNLHFSVVSANFFSSNFCSVLLHRIHHFDPSCSATSPGFGQTRTPPHWTHPLPRPRHFQLKVLGRSRRRRTARKAAETQDCRQNSERLHNLVRSRPGCCYFCRTVFAVVRPGNFVRF